VVLAHERAVRENRFYRHCGQPLIEMQQALIAMIVGGVFEFHPRLRVGSRRRTPVPGLLSRIEWDYPQYETPTRRTRPDAQGVLPPHCWAAVEGAAGDRGDGRSHRGGSHASRPTTALRPNSPTCRTICCGPCRGTAAQIPLGGAGLYGFTEADFAKADAAAPGTPAGVPVTV
jgi:hypothetical protein